MRVGVNYLTFRFAPDGSGTDSGVIGSYHLAPDLITYQLRTMRSNGMNFLRLPVCFYEGARDGINLDPTINAPVTQSTNILRLLTAIKAAGFQEIELAFCPQGHNSPSGWAAWDEPRYQQNWGFFIWLADTFLEPLGLPYRLDLNNELTIDTDNPMAQEYRKRLWGDYAYSSKRSLSKTVGFSIDPTPAAIQQILSVYGDRWPDQLSLHDYRGVARVPGWGSAYDTFEGVHKALTDAGHSGPLSIGETGYDEPEIIQEFLNAIKDSGRVVPSIALWPIDVRLDLVGSANVIPLDLPKVLKGLQP